MRVFSEFQSISRKNWLKFQVIYFRNVCFGQKYYFSEFNNIIHQKVTPQILLYIWSKLALLD